MLWEELIVYFPWYDMNRIENDAFNNSTAAFVRVSRCLVTAGEFLLSRCLKTIGEF
jgi:hypothetical protein